MHLSPFWSKLSYFWPNWLHRLYHRHTNTALTFFAEVPNMNHSFSNVNFHQFCLNILTRFHLKPNFQSRKNQKLRKYILRCHNIDIYCPLLTIYVHHTWGTWMRKPFCYELVHPLDDDPNWRRMSGEKPKFGQGCFKTAVMLFRRNPVDDCLVLFLSTQVGKKTLKQLKVS